MHHCLETILKCSPGVKNVNIVMHCKLSISVSLDQLGW